MTGVYIFMILLLSSLSSAGQNPTPPSDTSQQPGGAQSGNTTTRRAPDGDAYTPPSSVQPRPKSHGSDPNPGRPPAPAHGGGGTGWIAGVGAAGGALALGEWLHARNKPQAKLSREGPKMPNQFSMSVLAIGAFVQANWPVVFDYFLAPGGILLITVEAGGLPAFNYRIETTGRRQQEVFRLPPSFPQKPTPGSYTIRTLSGGAGAATPVYLRLFGVGAGERAVGSVAIDQVTFGPDIIHPRKKEGANYGFHAHTDFDHVRAEFLKAVMAQGQLMAKLDDHNDIDGVQRETAPSFQWSGKKATPGEHMLQVRAWESALDKANWVIAWSADQVLVEE